MGYSKQSKYRGSSSGSLDIAPRRPQGLMMPSSMYTNMTGPPKIYESGSRSKPTNYSGTNIDTRGYMGASRATYEALRPHHADPSKGYAKSDYMSFSRKDNSKASASYKEATMKMLKHYKNMIKQPKDDYLKRDYPDSKGEEAPCSVCGDQAMGGSPFCLYHFLNQN